MPPPLRYCRQLYIRSPLYPDAQILGLGGRKVYLWAQLIADFAVRCSLLNSLT